MIDFYGQNYICKNKHAIQQDHGKLSLSGKLKTKILLAKILKFMRNIQIINKIK